MVFIQTKNGLPAWTLALDEVDGGVGGFVIDRLHALLGQRAGVLDRLLADLAPARLLGRVVVSVALQSQDAARAELWRNAGSCG